MQHSSKTISSAECKRLGLFVCVISGFGFYVNEIFALLGYYTSYIGNSVPNFRGKLSLPFSRFLENGFIIL